MSQISASVISLLLCSFSLYSASAAPFRLFLRPEMIKVELNTWANFTCSLRCDYKQNFRIQWSAGRHLIQDGGDSNMVIEMVSDCNAGAKRHREVLSIKVDSADLHKTPLQCIAVPNSRSDVNHYSPYSVLQVDAPAAPDTKMVATNCAQQTGQDNQTTEKLVTEPLASTATTEQPTGTVQQQEAESA